MNLMTRKKCIICRNWRARDSSYELGSRRLFLEMKHHAFTAIAKLPRILNRFSATATARLVLQKAKRLVDSHR